MTVLEVLENASLYLDLRQDLDYYFNEDNVTLPSSENQNKFNLMLKALNLILQEIAIEYKPVFLEEEIEFLDGKASLELLSESVNKIVSVSDENKLYKFSIVDGYIVCNINGNKKVKYSIIPSGLDADDDIECFCDEISVKTLTFGVLMEYFFLNNRFDEVSVWEERFYKSLKNSLRQTGRINMPKRRWI